MDDAYKENQPLLIEFFHTKNIEIRNQIVEKNIGLVRAIAHSVVPYCAIPFEDLVQVGSCGLIKAVDKFDPNRKRKLSSFATPFIKGAILQYIRDKEKLIRIPRKLYETYQKINKHANRSQSCYNIAAEDLGYKRDAALEAYTAYNHKITEIPANIQYKQEEIQSLFIPIDRLNEVEYTIIVEIYINNGNTKTAGKILGISRSEVKKKEQEALKKLKSFITGYPYCPKCGSVDIVKNGKRGIKQSFICKKCKHQFTQNPKPRGRQGHSTEIKIKVLEAIASGKSLHWCEIYLGVDHSTAHSWDKKYILVTQNHSKFLSKKIMIRPSLEKQLNTKFKNLAIWIQQNYYHSENLDVVLKLIEQAHTSLKNNDQQKQNP